MAKILGDNKIFLEKVRLAFPHLDTVSPKTGKYGCALIFGKDSEEAKLLEETILKVAKEGFGSRADKVLAGMKRTDKYPLKDGDTKADYAGYAGMAFCNANSNVAPTCITRDRRVMNEQEIKEFMYAGAVVNAIVALYKYDSSKGGGDGVGVGLQGVQFVENAERFSGGGKAKAEEFPELPPLEEDETAAAFG